MSAVDERRGPGPLAVPARLATALGKLRAASGVTAEAELRVDRVRHVELAVGMRFEDDLLAVFAAAVPRLAERHRLTLGGVVGMTGALREHKIRGDLVGIGRAGASSFLCVQLRQRSGEPTRLVVHDADDHSERTEPLVDWIEGVVAGWPEARAATPAPFEAHVTPAMTESYNTQGGRRVRHRIFGEGRVLTETGAGDTRKVKVDFPRVGLKLLHARFLEFLDD